MQAPEEASELLVPGPADSSCRVSGPASGAHRPRRLVVAGALLLGLCAACTGLALLRNTVGFAAVVAPGVGGKAGEGTQRFQLADVQSAIGEQEQSGGYSVAQIQSDGAAAPPTEDISAPMSFYMYRAQSDNDYPMKNVNTANLAGVMWYLHNEIVRETPRKYNITRIMRLKVTVRNPDAWIQAHHTKFGPYVAFDQGMCTVPNCQHIWDTWGGVVGCQACDQMLANYRSNHQTLMHRTPNLKSDRHAPLWYSLPGPCPSQYFEYKNLTPSCSWDTPGGFCGSRAVTGARDCTYWVEWAGQVRLDELEGITNYTDFIMTGMKEYEPYYDTGIGLDFWHGIRNATACQKRMDLLNWLFYEKTGFAESRFPRDLPEPFCDSPR